MTGTVDLTSDPAFTMQLLDDTYAWRHRSVRQYHFGAGSSVRVATEYQLEFTEASTRPYARGAERMKILLPLTTRAKGPIAGLDIRSSDGTPVHLLMRSSTAALQAEYLLHLGARCSGESSRAVTALIGANLLEAIAAHTPYKFREFRRQHPGRHNAVYEYLRSGLGLPAPPGPALIPALLRQSDRAASKLLSVLQEPPDPTSSSELVVLALPLLDPAPSTWSEVAKVVADYDTAIWRLAQDGSEEASDVLLVLAEYGRRYEMILELEVPIDEPCSVTVTEDEAYTLRRGQAELVLPFGEARSVHIQCSLTDTSVEFKDCTLHAVTGRPLTFALLDGVTVTRERVAIYSAELQRPYFAALRVRFVVGRSVQVAGYTIAALVLASVVVAAMVPSGTVSPAVDLAQIFGVLAVPTTFAVVVILSREQTRLALRLQRILRFAIGSAVVVLWAVVLFRIVRASL